MADGFDFGEQLELDDGVLELGGDNFGDGNDDFGAVGGGGVGGANDTEDITVTLIINQEQDCKDSATGHMRKIEHVRVKSNCVHLGNYEVPHVMEESQINFGNYKLFHILFPAFPKSQINSRDQGPLKFQFEIWFDGIEHKYVESGHEVDRNA